MKNIGSYLFALLIVFVSVNITSCTKDRKFDNTLPPGTDTLSLGDILVNEVMSKGVGSEPDWIELYNPGPGTYKLLSGNWYLTDDLTDAQKFKVNTDVNMPPGSYLQVFCDGSGTITGSEIHTSFSLSSGGEQLGFAYSDDLGLRTIDSVTFPASPSPGNSYARVPNGSSTWVQVTTPTPGASND